MKNEFYVKCNQPNCNAPVQGTIEVKKTSTGPILAFSGVCTNGHNTGRTMSKEMISWMESKGWKRPDPGKTNTFTLPKVKPKEERTVTLTVPNDADLRWVLVNLDNGRLIQLPGAKINERLAVGSNELVELHIVLGQPEKRKKPNKKQREAVAMAASIDQKVKDSKRGPKKAEPEPEPEKPSNPFKKTSQYYELADRLLSKGKLSRSRLEDLDEDKFIKILKKHDIKVKAKGNLLTI